MADMFAPLVAQLKANPKTIVFTEGNDPRILEAASKLLAEGVLKVVMVGNEAECKAAAAAGNFDISAAEIIDPENYAGFDEMVNTMVELRKGKQTLPEPLVEKLSTATFGSMPNNFAVLAVSIATSASFAEAAILTSPVALSMVSV